MSSPIVTVLMPVHNGAAFLREAIESILCQTLHEFELLVVNDGSTDRTREVLTGYSDPRLIVVENERNLGLVTSLNKGIELARGEFVARMDHDDLALPGRLQRQVDYLGRNAQVGLCGTWFQTFGDGAAVDVQPPARADDMAARLFIESPLGHPTVMFRRALLAEGGLQYNDGFPFAEDYELWTRVAEVTELANLPEILLRYRQHAEQSSSRSKLKQEETVAKIRIRQLLKIYPGASEAERSNHLALLSNGAIGDSQADFVAVESWLLKLLGANESAVEGFPVEAFRRVIALVWWRYCSSRPSASGLLRAFYRSELTQNLSLRSKLAILVARMKAGANRP